MTFFSEIIPFTLPGSTGTFSVSHIQYPAETGKAAILVSVDVSGTNSVASYSYGVDDGITHIGTGVGFTQTFGVDLTARGRSSLYSLVKEQSQAFFGGYQVRALGFVSAFHAGSVDITLDMNNTPGAQWYLVVIGGTDTLCKVVNYTSNDPGTQDCGFDPIALVKLDSPVDGTSIAENSGAAAMFGFACPCHGKQAAWGFDCGGGSSAARSVQIANIIDAAFNNGSSTSAPPDRERTISSYPANGFAVGGDSFVNGDFRLGALAIGGSAVAANIVPINEPATNISQNTTIDAVSPRLVLVGGSCLVGSLVNVQPNANVMFGAFDGVNQVGFWCGTQDGASFPYQFHSRVSAVHAVTMATATGPGTSTSVGAGTVSMSSTTVGTSWIDTDGTARQVWALVIADAVTTPCGSGATPTATITVTKTTSPTGASTSFHFTTTGGLVPSDFTLMDGESRVFDVVAGTYGVTEDTYDQWTTVYVVTGGAPHTAVPVTAGQAKTIAVTNTRRYAPSGETVQWRLQRLDIKSRNEQTG